MISGDLNSFLSVIFKTKDVLDLIRLDFSWAFDTPLYGSYRWRWRLRGFLDGLQGGRRAGMRGKREILNGRLLGRGMLFAIDRWYLI